MLEKIKSKQKVVLEGHFKMKWANCKAFKIVRLLTFVESQTISTVTITHSPPVWPYWTIFEVLGDRFSYKSSPFGLFRNIFEQKRVCLLFGQLLEKFIIYHLCVLASGHAADRGHRRRLSLPLSNWNLRLAGRRRKFYFRSCRVVWE